MIDWLKRCKRDDTQMAERRVYESRCRQYKVEECNIKYGRKFNKQGVHMGFPLFFRAMIRTVLVEGGAVWTIISTHKTLNAARLQCEYYQKHGHIKIRNTSKNRRAKAKKAKRGEK